MHKKNSSRNPNSLRSANIATGFFLLLSASNLYAQNSEVGGAASSNQSHVDSQSICGVSTDYQHVERYDGNLGTSKILVYQNQGAVGQVRWNNNLASIFTNPGNVNSESWCTGTLVSPSLFLTAGHCFEPKKNDNIGWDSPIDDLTGGEIPPPVAAINMSVDFNHQEDSSGELKKVTSVNVIALREYKLGGLDYALLELDRRPGNTFGYASIATELPKVDERLTIIQHPVGLPKMVDAGYFSGIKTYGTLSGYMRYKDLDTGSGSSGAGVLNSAGKLVGVHGKAGCTRTGGSNHGVFVGDILYASPLLSGLVESLAQKQVHYWSMSHGARNGGSNIYEPVGQEWGIKGAGDVNSDGTEDIVWQNDKNDVHYWSMVNGIRVKGKNIASSVSKDQRLMGVGDLNGDGTDDIVWQHINGQVSYWPMSNGEKQGEVNIHNPVGDWWYLKGIGDMNGDGTDDIIWQYKDKNLHYWRMKSGARKEGRDIQAELTEGWQFRGIGDVDENGTDDIIWQDVDGQVRYWSIRNGKRVSEAYVYFPMGEDWSLESVGDVNGDRTADFIWEYRPSAM